MSDLDYWELRRVLSCSYMYVLVRKDADKTFLEKFAEKRQNREAALNLTKALQHIKRDGIERSLAIGLVKRLKDSIVEVKVFGTVVRCVAYQKAGKDMLVLLSVERSHQGSGNMNRSINEAERKINIVEALIAAMEED